MISHTLNFFTRELGDSATLAQCSYDLGSLHLRDHRPRVALTCFQEALDMAREQRNDKLEATSLQEMAQVHVYAYAKETLNLPSQQA